MLRENIAFTKVDITRGDAALFEHQSLSSDKPLLEGHVNLDDSVTETAQAEDMAVSTAASSGSNNEDVNNLICPSSELVCSLPRNATEPLESLSIPEDPHLTRLDLDEVISAEPLSESQVQMEVTSIDWDSNPYKPVSEDHPNQEERNATVLETNPFDSALPSFGVLPVPEASQVYPEAMPPLPPMQWRLGKIEPASLDADRDMIDNSEGTFPPIQPFVVDQKVHFDFPSLDREIAHHFKPISVSLC
ncbi:hypothetical protein OIU79_012622 [Salix purpurea]|uniref:Protein SCAR n=1 Tax=Salix purpurea TaxID=77065 RepID=A0A9Q0Q3P4_SALPP|nr:hypothetical protein OIU79_012622 [Salix purpurea]